jgi:hypothetical protein
VIALLAAVWLHAAVPAAPGEGVPPPRVRSTLDAILTEPEYRRLLENRPAPAPSTASSSETVREPRRAERPKARWREAPAPSGGGAAAGVVVPLLQIVAYVALAAAVLWVVVLVVRHFARGETAPESLAPAARVIHEAPASAPGERESDEYVQQALAQARGGRHREAIRLLLMGAMSFIERGGFIRHRTGLTNADYLRAVRRQPRLSDALEPIVLAFDEVYFGRRGANAERFDACLRSYRAGFGRS